MHTLKKVLHALGRLYSNPLTMLLVLMK